jgi:hypothetical protein
MTAPPPDLAILVEWAIFSRSDWEAGRVEGAVLAAKGAQWPEARIGLFLVRMVWDTASTPWDLINAARQPQGTAACVPASPEAIARYAAEARTALAAKARPAA